MAKVNPVVKLVIGLGNPDKQYENTYHNVGFLAVDYIAKNTTFSLPAGDLPKGDKFQILSLRETSRSEANSKVIKSEVFMNQSGLFVKKTAKKIGAKPEEILIIHDDSDIELGRYKLCFGRGSAGHRGVQSIIDTLGTKNFWRLRIGIGKSGKKIKAEKIVLKKITKADWEILQKTFSETKL